MGVRAGLHAALLMLAGLVIVAGTPPAQANAWPREEGELFTIMTVGVHRLRPVGSSVAPRGGVTSTRSANLKKPPPKKPRKPAFRPGPELIKSEIALYAEYGLTRRITAMGRVGLQTVLVPGLKAMRPVSGVSGLEAGLRAEVFSTERWSVSAQAMVITRGYGVAEFNDVFAHNEAGIELRAIAGRGIGESGFMQVQLGYRDRTGGHGDEVRLDTAFGFGLPAQIDVMVQTFSVWSDGHQVQALPDFSGHRAQFSVVTPAGQGRRLQLGILSTVRADAMAQENTIFAGLWQRF